MKFLMNIALAVVFIVSAFCITVIYGKGLFGFVVLMAFTFMSILIVIVANHNNL
jgi:hypothetical protein